METEYNFQIWNTKTEKAHNQVFYKSNKDKYKPCACQFYFLYF